MNQQPTVGYGRGRLKQARIPVVPDRPTISQPCFPTILASPCTYFQCLSKHRYSHFCGVVPARTGGTISGDDATAQPITTPAATDRATIEPLRMLSLLGWREASTATVHYGKRHQ